MDASCQKLHSSDWDATFLYLATAQLRSFLFHGTSAAAAEEIADGDFTMRLAGSATGILYGKGRDACWKYRTH